MNGLRSRRGRAALCAVLSACLSCSKSSTPGDHDRQPAEPLEGWVLDHVVSDVTASNLTGIWARADGDAVVVGWDGTILRERNAASSQGDWEPMSSGTGAHLTAVTGVDNGARFGLPAADGEMFAVGWHGTLLHFHPNPDGDPETDDGVWRAISSVENRTLMTRLRVDPACPDYDGDGMADDGDGSGWWGDSLCTAAGASACDDNCRTSPNGPERPLADLNGDSCLGPGDGPSADASFVQRDSDGDGAGAACDDDDELADPPQRFERTLFGVWARAQGDQLTVVAVGEDGALVTYQGPSAAAPPAPPALGVDDPDAWVAQLSLSFRYDNDCPAGTPAGQSCAGIGSRLPPSCPAECSPLRTTCVCMPAQGQCCDAAASTGAGCSDGSCPPAANACDTGTGVCTSLCPECFRRLDSTLRAVAASDDTLVAVGAGGVVLVAADATDPAGLWIAPRCNPAPLDGRPKLTAVASAGGAFHLVGSAGAVLRHTGAPDCGLEPRAGAPPIFLTSVTALGANRAIAVGDDGTILEVGGGDPQASHLDLELPVNSSLLAVSYDHTVFGRPRLRIVGAGGLIAGALYWEP